MKLLGLLSLSLSLISGFSGCASAPPSESDAVSTIPWNRPATWEGQGPLGGMMMMGGH